MLRTLHLGRFFNIPVRIHWSFWLLPAFVMTNTYLSYGIDEAWLNLALVMALFGCVLLHEFGHALTARRFGIGTANVTLYPIGGVARLERISESPWEEFWITLFGPLVNVSIAGLLALAIMASGHSLEPVLESTPFWQNFWVRLMWMNVALVIFNLLPAFPMDGGRILRSLLAARWSRLTATKIAARVGLVMACGFAILGFYVGNPMLIVLAGMVAFLGQQEYAQLRRQQYQRMYADNLGDIPQVFARIKEMLPPEMLIDPKTQPTEPNFTGHTWNPSSGMWIEWVDGRPISASPVWRV